MAGVNAEEGHSPDSRWKRGRRYQGLSVRSKSMTQWTFSSSLLQNAIGWQPTSTWDSWETFIFKTSQSYWLTPVISDLGRLCGEAGSPRPDWDI